MLYNLLWLAPGELPVEAQFTEFQQGARGASLVTNNRPRWCANIETAYKMSSCQSQTRLFCASALLVLCVLCVLCVLSMLPSDLCGGTRGSGV